MSPVDHLPNGERRAWTVDGPSTGSGSVERLAAVVPSLPCSGCAHAPVCAIRPTLSAETLATRPIASPHPAIRVRLEVEVACEHFLEGPSSVPTHAEPTRSHATAAEVAQSRRNGTAAMLARRAAAKAAGEAATAKRQPGRHPGKKAEAAEKSERARRVMEAMGRLGGDQRAVAAELGMRPNAVAMVVKFAAARVEASA